MIINKDVIEKLNPCIGSFQQGLKDYPSWEGNFIEFLDLDKINDIDKIWVFSKLPFSDELKREFAFMCAARAVDECDLSEVKDFFMLILFQYEASYLFEHDEEYWAAAQAANCAADCAAYWAADWAAYRAADWAVNRDAEQNIQIEMIKYLLEVKDDQSV